MTPDLSKALLNPQLWRLEAARRRRQLEDLQAFLATLEREYAQLETQVRGFEQRYEDWLGRGWSQVETLQGELLRALESLARARGAALPPPPPQRRRHPLPDLPAALPFPEPPAGEQAASAPTLKELHRRAAMRLHPDRATEPADRERREALMRDANLAYADADRATLEALLIASGESPQRLGGFDVHAHWRWLERCEHIAQGRLRVLRAHLVLLRQHPLTVLAEAVERAEARGLAPLAVMAARLAAQQQELQQQLYIGARLQPGSALSAAFLAQWQQRWGAEPPPKFAQPSCLSGS
ncbi:hypothetical protein [Inhella sp.]|uniref:J domain-containing protein n=1 Tax=Inhella sp. TaxID=1921806 RepID=UPI0035B21DE9